MLALAAASRAAAPPLEMPASAEACGRCHGAIHDAWKLSAHASAMESRLFQDALELTEEAIAALDEELAQFRKLEKQRAAQTLEQARTMTKTFTVILFGLGIILIGVAIFLYMRRNPFLPMR